MGNPFRLLREQHGFTQAAWALRLGLSVGTVIGGEHGLAGDPKTLLDALARAGFDREQLAADYRKWREAQALTPPVPA